MKIRRVEDTRTDKDYFTEEGEGISTECQMRCFALAGYNSNSSPNPNPILRQGVEYRVTNMDTVY